MVLSGSFRPTIDRYVVFYCQLFEFLFQARFVESESPLASSVGYSFIENKESTVYLSFQNVPKDKIPLVAPELKTVLQEIVSGKVVWDRSRMSTVIQRRISEQMSQAEMSKRRNLKQIKKKYQELVTGFFGIEWLTNV